MGQREQLRDVHVDDEALLYCYTCVDGYNYVEFIFPFLSCANC